MREPCEKEQAAGAHNAPGSEADTVSRPDNAARHFCTYFDSNFTMQGLLMIESLRQNSQSPIHVLCLDELVEKIVRERQPAVRVIPLAQLESFDPELAAAKANRSRVEYYFTCTPCLPRYVLHTEKSIESITYLDSDLYFYGSPARIFEEIADCSIAIVPHRFSSSQEKSGWGKYNVGWITWRNDAEGRRCLDDYRRDCIAWCYDRREGGKFADQKYLDAWPQRYRSVHEITGKGINLAPWNVENYALTVADGRLFVDGEPVIFYHYSRLKSRGWNKWDAGLRYFKIDRPPLLLEHVYRPYVRELERIARELERDYGFQRPTDIRFPVKDKKAVSVTAQSRGYAIVDRDTAVAVGANDAWRYNDVGEWQHEIHAKLVEQLPRRKVWIAFAAAAKAVRACALPNPTLVEVGCASGYYQAVFQHYFAGSVRYVGVDRSPLLVGMAQDAYPGTPFAVADATKLPFENASFDICFNGVSLMHIVDYEAAIAEARRVARHFCIFHTVPMLKNRPTTFLTKLAYGRAVPEIIFNEDELLTLLARNRLAIRERWPSIPYDLSPLIGEATENWTYLCAAV